MSIIQKYKEQINQINKQIELIQQACTHPEVACDKQYHEVRDEYGSSEGGFYSITCNLCEKKFQKDVQK